MKNIVLNAVDEVGAALFSPKGPRLTDDDSPSKQEEFITRRMRELRIKARRYETIFCQVDRSTGEIIIPKRTRGMIAALRRQAEHRMMGWIVAAFVAFLAVASFRQDATTASPSLEHRPIPRRPAARAIAPVAPLARPVLPALPTPPAPAPPPLQQFERVKVGAMLRHRREGDKLVLYSEDVYETRPVSPKPQSTSAQTRLLNINTATLDELDRTLQGVGPVMAQRIIDARPFTSVEGLRDVAGIGPQRFKLIASDVTVN